MATRPPELTLTDAPPAVVPLRAPRTTAPPLAPAGVIDHGWVVAEIRQDGTVGPWEIVTAPGAMEAVRSSRPASTRPAPTVDAGPALDLHLGRLQAAQGHHGDAVRCMTRALRSAATGPLRHRCLAELALVEAYAGQLHRSAEHDEQATKELPGVTSGLLELAAAWRDLAHGELAEAWRRLDRAERTLDESADPWCGTLETLLAAELSMAGGRPEAATRVLADAPAPEDGAISSWSASVLAAARADALLAEGEGHRALSLVTPLPAPALAEAGVVAADARAAIGDARGARAVLAAVLDEVDVAPLATQVRVWLLEARLEQHRGRAGRARLLVNRALEAASAEGMRTPLRRESRWLRAMTGRDAALLHAHRSVLASLTTLEEVVDREQTVDVSHGPATDADDAMAAVLATRLTHRERQVLELLAEMYSTEEIAAALYVSGNTVKTHLKGIFSKLCVNRRVDAVRRGRQLGLC